MLMSHHQNIWQNCNIKIAHRPFEDVAKFRYFGMKEIKSRLNSNNACCHSFRNHCCSCLLYEKVKIKTYKTIILPVVLYGCETWSLTIREEHRLSVRLLRRMFGLKRDEVVGGWIQLCYEESLTRTLCSLPSTVRLMIEETWQQHRADTTFLTDCCCNCR
jgi:hypothetical protein